MARPPGVPGSDEPSEAGAVSEAGLTQPDRLVTLLELCKKTQAAAEAQGEKLIAYLLAMAVEETRTAIQRSKELMDQND